MIMPQEPDPNIEKLVETYAKQRRDQAGAPFELSGAGRRRLLAAVERQFEQKSSGGWLGVAFWRRFWPQIVAFSGVTAVMVAVLIMNWPATPNESKILAQNTPVAPKAAPARNAQADRLAASAAPRAKEEKSSPLAPSSPDGSETAKTKLYYAKDKDAKPVGGVVKGTEQNKEAIGVLVKRAKEPNPQDMAFQIAQTNDLKVLTSFRILRDGQTIRVVDSDGSVYTGSVLPEKMIGVAVQHGFASESYEFHVAGTNQTLKQLVEFSGAVKMPLDRQQLVARRAVDDQSAVGDKSGSQAPVLTGQVKVGKAAPISLQASESQH